MIQLEPNLVADAEKDKTPAAQRKSMHRRVLKAIENLYLSVMGIDELYRKWSETSANPEQVPQEIRDDWNRTYTRLVKSLWTDLCSMGLQAVDAKDVLAQTPSAKGLSAFLSYAKGRRLIVRILRFLPQNQTYVLLKTVFLSLKTIALASVDPVAVLKELDDYANRVVFPFVPIISEAPMTFITECLETVLKAQELIGTARTKPGLLFLTLFMSRAEIIKQRKQADATQISKWTDQVFPAIFSSFQTRFAALFPPMHILPPIVTSSVASLPQPIPVDDQYVWQFLAAMAMGASPDQQRILVMESRDRIFETARMQGQPGRDKVNIFLNALGLDVSQLAA